jgi:cell division transport system ATP-binding protein
VVCYRQPLSRPCEKNAFEIVRILKKINELGTTVLLTTHNKGVVEEVGGRVITMEKGKIVRDDKKGKFIL